MGSSNDRLAKVSSFVKNHLEEAAEKFPGPQHDPRYRWQHTLRVSNYGKIIAEAEGADVELAIAACLLHDVAHFESEGDYKSHGRLGARISRPVLLEIGYSPRQAENICYAIAVHVDGKSDFEHPETIESKVVTDADNVDRFGAYRVLQWCVPEMNEYDLLVEKLTKRLETLENYREQELLETITGQELFNQQLELQINFFKEILKEKAITELPYLGS
jgi:putative nucleotidyltransferase with HDIG domain